MPRDVTFMHTWEPSLEAPNATSQADLDSTLPQSATRENKDVATMWTMYAFLNPVCFYVSYNKQQYRMDTPFVVVFVTK